MRIMFWGMRGMFALPPLEAALAAGQQIVAVVVPTAKQGASIARLQPAALTSPIPVLNPHVQRSIVELAWERSIPVLAVTRIDDEVLEELRALAAEVAIVACWPRRLPAALLAISEHGFLNIHPSLLPQYRGPEPVFWTLREHAAAGVTVHRMDARYDSGPIAAQAEVTLPDGASGTQIDHLLAQRGARLLATTLDRLDRGNVPWQFQPARGSYAPVPQPGDFRIDTSWTARHAFNFMRGTDHWHQPYYVDLDGERIWLERALGFQTRAGSEADGTVTIPLRDGILLAVRLASE